MRLLAAALFAGLALIAVAIVVTGDRWVWSDNAPSFAEWSTRCEAAHGHVEASTGGGDIVFCVTADDNRVIDVWTPQS
jgi:hypothetical protein